MKKLVQWLFTLFGLKITRARYARKYLPKPCVDNVEVVVKFFALANWKANLLQVGACDGFTSDSVYPYIKANKVNAILVEPSTVNFSKLQEFYHGHANVTCVNAAVAEGNERKPFYTIKNEGRWKDSGWARQLASFYKAHLLKHGIRENEIAVENVDCKTLSTLLKEYGLQEIDILLIDTEGFDGEIVKMAFKENIKPLFIFFENAQLVQNYSQAELDELYSLIKSNGYVWSHDRINTMAVRGDFFLSDMEKANI